MYSKAVLALPNVSSVPAGSAGKHRDDAFTCFGVFAMISAVERIIRVDKEMEYVSVFDRSMQNTLYKYAMESGHGGYHGFYECFNWDAACKGLYDTFQGDAMFAIQLYARWRRVKLLVDGEQVGGSVDDGIFYDSADISIESLGGDEWGVEVLYE